MTLIVAFNNGIGEEIVLRVDFISNIVIPFDMLGLSSKVYIVVH
jgi:hypothetical protein